ncbi:MAG TPA: cyclic dehypoxanthinyl futalosine synthase [Planctomycetota bacterium]|jgi:cyclic dehypoxanthinyl futalosine synthase|nr:cyclic dehypoxanthinyl futalosine synthase [Planctomycetota bacterium]
MDRAIPPIAAKLDEGAPLSQEEALLLLTRADLLTLGALADSVRSRLHPEGIVTYIVDRNVNPTNVCVTDCSFCAFYRRPGDGEGYLLPREVLYRKIEELRAIGGNLVLMQGGHHPHLRADWYAELFADLKSRFPGLHLHALSPPEIHHLAKLERGSVRDVIARLRAAGLDSIPGGGAEILVDRVRKAISPKKCSTEEWLEVMREAHAAGLRTTATMMYGTVETAAERIIHLSHLRDLQSETGGFTMFAAWNFQPHGTPLGARLGNRTTTPAEYFRLIATARAFLHNFRNLQASYVTQGLKAAQLSLRFGVNDFGGTMMEENVVSAAGCFHLTEIEEIERAIEAAGFAPRRRNFFYEIVDARPLPAAAGAAA